MKKFSRLIVMILALSMCLSFIPATATADFEVLALPTDGIAVIEDGVIRITVDLNMNVVVYQNNNGEWIPVTKTIEKMGAGGATAPGVAGAWANALPWSANTGTGTSNFLEASAKILSPKSSYVTTGAELRNVPHGTTTPATAGTDSGELLLSDNFHLIDFLYEENVKTYASGAGTGKRLTLAAVDYDLLLRQTLVYETGAIPGAISVSSYYTYLGIGELTVTKFVDNNFKFEADQLEKLYAYNDSGVAIDTRRAGGLWSWQGCNSMSAQSEPVMPVLDTMGTMTAGQISGGGAAHGMSRNNWGWSTSAGIAYNYFWGSNMGLGIGSLMPYHVYGLELPVRGSGINGNYNIGYAWVGWPGKTLVSGKEAYIGTSLIAVVDGDLASGTNAYARMMDNVDVKPFIDRGDFVSRTDPVPTADKWSLVIDGFDYAIPRYEYKYGENDYKGVPTGLLTLPNGNELADWARRPAWETWGYGNSFAPRALFYLVPILARLGYGSITYDAGWYDHTGNNATGDDPIYMPRWAGSTNTGTTCDWGIVAPLLSAYFAANPHSKHVTAGDAYDFSNLNTSTQTEAIRVVRAMNEYIHEYGMHVLAWIQTSYVRPAVLTTGMAPESWTVRNANGTRNGSYGCTGNPEFINTLTTYMSELIYGTGKGEYAFDGYKGDSINGIAPCFADGHGHDGDPLATIRNYGLFYKNLFDKACYLRGATEYVGGPIVDVNKMPAIKHCMCGRRMDYYTFSGVNRPIWGDHGGTRSNRQVNNVWRGLYGFDIPMDSDHHELDHRDDGGRAAAESVGDFDYATPLGTGMLFASKYRINLNVYESAVTERSAEMWFPGRAGYEKRTNFSTSNPWGDGAVTWGRTVKYYGLYHDIQTVQSRFIDNLYKYAVDYPEAYALELLDRNPTTGVVSPKAVSERIYSFYATSFPIDATDPYVRNVSNCNYYRQMATNNGNVKIWDPWNSSDKNLPNTTATIQAYIPYTMKYEGMIEIRGLEPFTAYFLTDIETGLKLQKTADAFGNIAFDTMFINSVIYHVTKVASGSVSGFVYGENGAVLQGATITLYSKDGGRALWDTASDLDGFYSFPLVPAGDYTITTTYPKGYQAVVNGQQNNPVNLNYFDDVYEYVTAPFTVSNAERTIDLGPGAIPQGRVDGIPISIDFVDYDVWLEAYGKLEGVNAVEMVFSFDGGDMLSYIGFGGTLAELGFTPINLDAGAVGGVTWTQLPNGWRGKLLLGLSAQNVDLAGIIEKLITLSFQASKLGEVTLTVESLKISSLPEGGKVKTYEVNFPGGSESYTTVVHAFHPKYDLNKDGKVDIKDISIALSAVTWVNTAPGWDSKQIALTDAGAPITPSMVDVSQNLLGDGVIDILDVLDILRNFT